MLGHKDLNETYKSYAKYLPIIIIKYPRINKLVKRYKKI
jgi:hypothetical protein